MLKFAWAKGKTGCINGKKSSGDFYSEKKNDMEIKESPVMK